jgi:predicted RNA-binding Zn ribbon-like protein
MNINRQDGIKASNRVLLGGAPCLDFVNTKNWNDHEEVYDFFTEYHALLSWGLQVRLITPQQAEQQSEMAGRKTKESIMVLEQALALREVLYRIFFAIANQDQVSPADLALFNNAWAKALTRLQVQPDRKIFQWNWVGMDEALGSMLWPVLHSAAELLISEKLHRVKNCAGCGWLFLDTTKAGRRRWCDMRICGNREKSRRHYARTRVL